MDNAKKKKLIKAIVIIICCLCLYKLADATCYTLVRTEAEIYLCHKYDAKFSEVELTDHRRAGIYWDDYNIFWLTPKWVDFCFEFKYNDKNVMVNRFKGKFYDDYQLDDVESWCTQWLQQNVDERIIGFWLDSTDIYWYLHNTDKSHNYILTQGDTEEFLNNFSFNNDEDNGIIFYYYDESIDNEQSYNIQQSINSEITGKLTNKINLSGKIYSSFSTIPLKKVDIKSSYIAWRNMYMCI